MATTTNFGWETPDDTDLVKDGAAAIRTLGQSIDTSMMDLEGGTTGQVLSKASNADMDFTWVTTDDANAIQNAIVDAKGDLIAATAADTPARLAVGTNGQVLTADSTAATGIKWATPTAAGTWAAYTPSNTGVTLGNGTQTARYQATGKTVTVSYRLVLGSTSSFSGAISIGLPSTNASYSNCVVNATNSGTGNFLASGAADPSSGKVLIRPMKLGGTYVSWDDDLSGMFTWNTNDELKFFITYEEA